MNLFVIVSFTVLIFVFLPLAIAIYFANNLSENHPKLVVWCILIGGVLNVPYLLFGGDWVSTILCMDGWIIFWTVIISVVVCLITLVYFIFIFEDKNEYKAHKSELKVE